MDAGISPKERLRRAQAAFDGAVSDLNKSMADADEVSKSIPETPLTAQDIERIEAEARTKKAPEQMRELQNRIDKGEFSWRDILHGDRLNDPGVRAALSTSVPTLHRGYELIMEGASETELMQANPANTSRPQDTGSSRGEWDSAPDDEDSTNEPRNFVIDDD